MYYVNIKNSPKSEHEFTVNRKTVKPDLVFLEPDGKLIKRGNLDDRYKALAARHGHPGMTFHHLRYTHATILLSSGAYINDVSERLGHSDVATTMRIYAYTLPGKDTALADRFDKLLSEE